VPLRRFLLHVNYLPDLLRVIRKSSAVKEAVDDAIDQCAEVFNLRDSIEEARIRAEHATDERQKRSFAQRGTRYHYVDRFFHSSLRRAPKSAALLSTHRFPSILAIHRARYPGNVPYL
jgi:hypothetical protein